MTMEIESFPGVPDPVRLVAVCHTPGCPVEGQECQGAFYPYGDHAPPRYLGQCGRCQQPITDLRKPPPDVPTPAPGQAEPPAPAPVPVEPSPPGTPHVHRLQNRPEQ